MESPATMRLVGLLVIVGMVAGCGGDETTTPDAQTKRVAAALTRDDLVALRREQSDVFSAIVDLRNELSPPGTPTHAIPWSAMSELTGGQGAVMNVGPYSGMMEMAFLRGDDRAARIWRGKALAELKLAREHLARAREYLREE